MWIFFLVAMYLGGVSTQSSSNVLQGMGFVSIVMALICLYIIFKLMWRARGTIATVTVIGGVVLYSAYSLGLFGNKTVNGIITGEPSPVQEVAENAEQQQAEQQKMDSLDAQLFGGNEENGESGDKEKKTASIQERQVVTSQPADNGGLVGKIKTMLYGEQNNQVAASIKNMDITAKHRFLS